ncbi:FaeA/PapI family transcriptional regulator [Citrobacter rodentium]|jgi:FaeA-like protein.|uniref:Regulator n=2 Tax=Citrobacter rodentium TaxID=67825 RepID=D2TQU6_CITRI|nr:FaeA/PapI family transcriptional regulator [Citrobacter rodentium]QBY29885.1 regulator [Citrobacter rodentium]UHO32726.1 FaeA/PapI family transcriptional regulator [Citrobacter rodentium NBRC 105723 = DSM 16636]CBG90232.1 putative regulator [Citrobacter rodentium ICC168]
MKLSLCAYPSGALPIRYNAPCNNLQLVAVEMGISSFATVRVPEQVYILELLKDHSANGLSTRELADLCGISIYKVRHLLLPLEKYGQVIRDKMQKHHQWFLSSESTEVIEDSSKGDYHLQQTVVNQ